MSGCVTNLEESNVGTEVAVWPASGRPPLYRQQSMLVTPGGLMLWIAVLVALIACRLARRSWRATAAAVVIVAGIGLVLTSPLGSLQPVDSVSTRSGPTLVK
jgi:hypothetical protein